MDSDELALKGAGSKFDGDHAMRMQELKARVQRNDYIVDPAAVAVAVLRHAVSQRRCSNPRTVCATPSALSTTSGGPSATIPIQVSDAASASRLGPQTQSS